MGQHRPGQVDILQSLLAVRVLEFAQRRLCYVGCIRPLFGHILYMNNYLFKSQNQTFTSLMTVRVTQKNTKCVHIIVQLGHGQNNFARTPSIANEVADQYIYLFRYSGWYYFHVCQLKSLLPMLVCMHAWSLKVYLGPLLTEFILFFFSLSLCQVTFSKNLWGF